MILGFLSLIDSHHDERYMVADKKPFGSFGVPSAADEVAKTLKYD